MAGETRVEAGSVLNLEVAPFSHDGMACQVLHHTPGSIVSRELDSGSQFVIENIMSRRCETSEGKAHDPASACSREP